MVIKWNECLSSDFANIQEEDIALIIVSSLEQHALHLPTGTDEYIGQAVAEEAAGKCKRKVYMMPSVNYGFSYHHLKFKSSVSIKQTGLIGIIKDIIRCVYHTGFKKMTKVTTIIIDTLKYT
ncbi:Creatinine amidohydrolase [Anaerovirgula multivorans]|uniref:Creatinine amidohydrolase n=1 Tax=Anaerovirgula multivorans TaxID=312168 RepID=A0A239IEJ4_9FIRM|nr:creatininase family protein [Anaerovirgula multivorans]SNS90854.1 Creatinine amidohydrolase [Anaerovirgula multivorans]